jgi:hypothetical protein
MSTAQSTRHARNFLDLGTDAVALRFDHMHLRAHECRARAMEARELAWEAKRPATRTALEQAAEYWLGLAERVEQREQEQPAKPLHLTRLTHAQPNSMPVFRYFVSVGIALFFGLLAVSTKLQSEVPGGVAAAPTVQPNAALLSAKP